MRGVPWPAVRLLAGAAVLAAVVWRVGGGPFLDGLGAVDAATLALGAAIAVPTTVASAWRWHLVARGLGVGVRLGPAVASYYRSQFLNCTLPGGILGDVHRGVEHGRGIGKTGRALRSVFWERLAGQVVQVALTAAILVVLPSPVRSSVPAYVALAAVGLLAAAALTYAAASGSWTVPWVLRVAWSDVRSGLLARRVWPGVALASAVAVSGHVATFLVAARAAGVTVSTSRLMPLVLIVLLAMAVPLNVAGWGPREGVAAWSFAGAGLGAGEGVATTVVFGVMVLVATLPGAVVLVASRHAARRPRRPAAEEPAARTPEVRSRG